MRFNKILLLQQNMLGDVVCSTGVVKAFREQFSNSKIAFLVSPETADLVRLPFIDELVIYDKGMPLWPVIRQVWRYDIAIALDFKYRSAVIPFLARIPIRAGLAHKRKLFMTHAISLPECNNRLYIAEYMAEIIKRAIGLRLKYDVTKLYVADATNKDKENVTNLLGTLDKDSLHIAIAPFTSMKVKDWLPEYYKRFMLEIKQKMPCRFVILGAKSDKSKDFYLPEETIDLRGRTSLTETAEVLRRMDYFIGGCSAPLHIATAVETPALAFYGPTAAAKWAPLNKCVVLQNTPHCSPCDRNYGAVCNGNNTCMKSIKVEAALEGFNKLINMYPIIR